MTYSTGASDAHWTPFIKNKIVIDEKYHLKKILGCGGEGAVFLADVVVLNRSFGQVALKLRQTDFENHDLLDRQMEELRVATTLYHPHLLRGFVPGKCNIGFHNYLYLVMDRAEGTLEDRISPDTPLSEAETREVVQSIGSALVYLHNEERFAHRDVKPGNVLRVGEVWKLGDFGLVREVGDNTDLRTGTLQCTPAYTPPEFFFEMGRIELVWDVWSLGAMIVEMLTGKPLFGESRTTQVLASIRQAEPIKLTEDLPAPFKEIVLGCLVQDPKDRWSAAQVLKALNNKPIKQQLILRTNPQKPQQVRPVLKPKLSGSIVLPHSVIRQELRSFQGHRSWVRCVSFSPDGTQALSGGADRMLHLWDVNTGIEIQRFPPQIGSIYTVAFSPKDHRFALSGNHEKTLLLWDVTTGQEIRSFQGHNSAIRSVTFSPDGSRALSASDDTTIRLWDVNTGKEICLLKKHWAPVYSVTFSSTGNYAISSSADETMCLWDLNRQNEVRRFMGHESRVSSVAFSPDSSFVLSGSFDTTMRLWDVETGQEIRSFQGHTNTILSVAFSPDGRRAISGSTDRTLRLWDVETGQEICCCTGHTGDVWSVKFSPDGCYALSGSHDGTVRLWQLP
ncbi:MAG: serine/threonine-protein kinase [Crinalium sp.]